MKKRTIIIWVAVAIFLVVPLVKNTEEVLPAVTAPFIAIWDFIVATVMALAVLANTWLGIFS